MIQAREDAGQAFLGKVQFKVPQYHAVIKVLEKQIPKKVENYTIDCHGYMIYDCECPSCKTEHKEMYPFAYCQHCGQALEWHR